MRRIYLSFLFSVVMSVCVCGGTGEAGEDSQEAPLPYVAVDTVVDREESVTKRYTGHVTTKASVNLLVRVSGELLHIGFKEGDTVREGQMLYELDNIRYMAEVKNAKARVAECEARLIYAELSLSRAEGLYDQKAGTKEEEDKAESEYLAAQAALLSAEAQLITVEDDLKNTRITAPISGRIGQTYYTVGNYLTPASGILATINQLDPLRITFTMANRDLLDITGSELSLKDCSSIHARLADGSVYEHEGRIAFIDNQASRKTDAVRIFAEFDNPAEKLIPGSTVTILLSRKNGQIFPAVLPSAIMHDSRSPYVYVIDDENRVERRDVILGAAANNVQTVRSGVSTGERVIVDGTHKAVPGAKVEPVYHKESSLSFDSASDGSTSDGTDKNNRQGNRREDLQGNRDSDGGQR